jgi:peptidoglycan/xylan/chitin deacetylase (PgdA/CDA1 family)
VLGAAAAGLLSACTTTGTRGPDAPRSARASGGGSSSGAAAPPSASASSSSAASPAPSPTPSIDLQAAPASVIARSHVPILCYHQIRDWTPRDSSADRAYIMPPATFTAQLDALSASGYTTVTPDQLLAHLTTGAPLPERPVMLTYDDADADGYDVALPQMLQRGFTGTYFLMTVVLGKQHYLSADQVRELERAGMTIAAHTWDHHRVDRYSGNDWQVQIDRPTQEIAAIVGHPVRYFAYPYGAWSPAAFEHLQAAGFSAAFQLDAAPLDPVHPLFTIERKIANPTWSTSTLLRELATGF